MNHKLFFVQNKKKNEDIFILGNAPSIKENDLTLLRDKVSIGLNASPLLEDEYNFVSEFYVVSDARFLDIDVKKKIFFDKVNKRNSYNFFRKEINSLVEKPNFKKTFYLRSLGKNGFSFNLSHGFYFGCTTSMLAIQVAAFLGAKNIYLLGNDLHYSAASPRFYKEEKVQEFDSFTSVQINNIRNAYLALRAKNVNLFNCSKNSLLTPYLPYKDFSKCFNN